MCHRGGEIEQNAKKCQVSCPLLDPSFDNMTTEFSNQSLESENIFLKKTVAQLQKDLSRMEAHYVNMELKYQNQALKDGQHGQILNETSNKAKINKEIEVLEKINIELEHSVAKLLLDNGHKVSPNKSSDVHEKTNTPRSYLKWIPTGRIFNTYGAYVFPTEKKFTSSINQGTSFNPKKERLKVWFLKRLMSKNQVPRRIHKQEQSPNSAQGVKEQQLQRAYFDDPCHELLHKVYISQGSSSNVQK
ncbi:hypothetical protein Tco_0331036 [Tanacetum coccineum]